jgi:hypothetical protein
VHVYLLVSGALVLLAGFALLLYDRAQWKRVEEFLDGQPDHGEARDPILSRARAPEGSRGSRKIALALIGIGAGLCLVGAGLS